MIRINLLGVERQKARKSVSLPDAAQRTTFACCVIFGLTILGLCGWYWSLSREAGRLEATIATAQQELASLQPVLAEVKRAEEHREELQQRVAIIEELRRGQSVPVQLLDHVSRSLPEMLWLTSLDQKAGEVSIEGRTTTLISLADFVANLGTNRLVQKPIDIVNSQVETASSGTGAGVDLIRFSVKAPLVQAPGAGTADAGTPAPGGAPPAAR